MDDYVAATERRDVEVAAAHLAPDVVLHSPVTRRPFVGKDEVTELLTALLEALDDDGRIARETVFGRPLAGSAVFTQALGPRLAARHGRWRARLAGAAPLPALLEGIDRLGTRIARPHAIERRDP